MNNRSVYGYGEDGREGLKSSSCLPMHMVRCGWVGWLEKKLYCLRMLTYRGGGGRVRRNALLT